MVLNRRFAVLSIAMVFAAGCSEPTSPDPKPTFVGVWAGKGWLGDASAYLAEGVGGLQKLTIYAGSPTNPGYTFSEELVMEAVPPGTGTYKLGPESLRLMEIIGGDVIGATYTPTTSSPGTLVITVYNGVGGIIEGDIEFDGVTTSPYASHGLAASMKNGHFRAVVKTLPNF
jgi:hypothetical protein